MRKAELPRVSAIRVRYKDVPRLTDIEGEVRKQLAAAYAGRELKGMRIAITGPSRGIANYADLMRAQVAWFKDQGAQPFVFGAMGTHGGLSEEAILEVLHDKGITEEGVGCPVKACLETTVVHSFDTDGPPLVVQCSQVAWAADGIHAFGRVKRHTDMENDHESGLFKVLAIGAGQVKGAQSYHDQVLHHGLGWAINTAARHLISTGKVLGGLAVIENQYHEPAKVRAFSAASMDAGEAEFLKEANALMPRIPLPFIDLLYLYRAGKNISGTGADTKTIQRDVYAPIPGKKAWDLEDPAVWRIFVSTLTDQSHGNAVGMGLWEGISKRFYDTVDFQKTHLNAITGFSGAAARTPMVFPNDREGIEVLLGLCPTRASGRVFVAAMDTLALEHLLVSEDALPLLERDKFDIEVEGNPEPLRFDATGHLVLPFTEH